MDVIKVPPREQSSIIRNTQNPHLSTRSVRDFMQRATPDAVEDFYAKQRMGQDMQKAREPENAN